MRRFGAAVAALGLVGLVLVGSGSPAEAGPGSHRISWRYKAHGAEWTTASEIHLTCTIICTGRVETSETGYRSTSGYRGSIVGLLNSISTDPGQEAFAMRGLVFGSAWCSAYAAPCEMIPMPAPMIGPVDFVCTLGATRTRVSGYVFAFPSTSPWTFGVNRSEPCDSSGDLSELTIT